MPDGAEGNSIMRGRPDGPAIPEQDDLRRFMPDAGPLRESKRYMFRTDYIDKRHVSPYPRHQLVRRDTAGARHVAVKQEHRSIVRASEQLLQHVDAGDRDDLRVDTHKYTAVLIDSLVYVLY